MNNSKEETVKQEKSFRDQFQSETNIAPVFANRTPYIEYIEWLEAELKRKDEALMEITRTNWVNGKYFGLSSAQLHLAATKIAEQALKPKNS